jgi:hypothetical protein
MAHQLIQSPTLQRLLVGLEGDEVVRSQILETVGEATRQRHQLLAEYDHIQQLPLE